MSEISEPSESTGPCFDFWVRKLALKKTNDPGYRPGYFLEDGIRYQRKFDRNFDIQIQETPFLPEKEPSDLANRFFKAFLIHGAEALDDFNDRMAFLDTGISRELRRIAQSGSGKLEDVKADCFSLMYTNVRESRDGARYMIDPAVWEELDKSFRAAEKHCVEAVTNICHSPAQSGGKTDHTAFCRQAREVGYKGIPAE